MYAPNSALLNALAHHKINFKQVLKFIESRYDFEPTAFQNGAQKNAAGENQGSCKVFCFAHLNNFDHLDTLALFAEHYQAVKDNPEGTDHQNIRQFIHHGWAGIHFEGHALTPKVNIDAINAQAAQLYANGGSEFEEMAAAETATQQAQPETAQPIAQETTQQQGDAQPGATPQPNETSDKLSENMQNFAEPSAPKNADGSVDQQSGSTDAATSPASAANTAPTTPVDNDTLTDNTLLDQKLDDARLDEKAEQAILAAEAVKQPVIPPSPGSSNSMVSETTYYTDNDSVTDHTAQRVDTTPEASSPQTNTTDHTGATSMTDTTSQPENSPNHVDAKVNGNMNDHQSGNLSATELATANDQHIADNPAAFIDDSLDTAPSGAATNSPVNTVSTDTAPAQPVSASPSQQPAPVSQPSNSADKPDPSNNASANPNASGSASASASDIVESNASHIANNPAEFIEEKNTSTDASEPATTEQHTASTPTKADGDKTSS